MNFQTFYDQTDEHGVSNRDKLAQRQHIIRSRLCTDGTRQAVRSSGQVARTGKDAVFGDGVLRRTGRRARHEGVSSQDAALVLQGVFSCAAGYTGSCSNSRGVFADTIGC